MMKHSQITQSNTFANLCNISKKLEMEFIFCMQINTKVSKNWHYRFWWKQQIRRLVIFLQNIKKKVFFILTTAFVFYCNVKDSMGVQTYLLLLVFGWLRSKMGAVFYTMTFISDLNLYVYIYIYICIYIYIYISDITFPQETF